MWLSYHQGRHAALTDAEQRMGQLSQHTIDRYRAVLGDGYSVVTVASAIPSLTTRPTENLEPKIRVLLKSLDSSPYVNSIYAGYADGGFLQAASVDRNLRWMTASGAPRGTAYALRTIERPPTGPVSTWRFLDKEGRTIGQKVSNDVQFDPRQRPWYKAARNATGPVSVGPYVSAATRTLTQTIAVPIAGESGAVVGVDVMLETISHSLARDAVSENARGFVFDFQKKLIVHSDEAIMKQILESYGTASRDAPDNSVTDPAVDDARGLLSLDDDEDGRTVSFPVDGELYVARIATIGLQGTASRNTVVLVAPVADFIGESARLLKKNLIVAALFLAAGILAALLFSRLISRALLALSEDARHIGNLEFQAHKPTASWISEINTLSAALGSAREAIKTFALYVPRELVRRIVTAGQASAGQAVRQEVTVLFTDIRDFTTISEVHSPEDVVGMLSDYFELMNGIVEQHQGVIIQYLGDSIYAMWNAPTADPRHVDDGCRCALALKRAIDELNARNRAEGRPELVTRFGLHTGIAVVGSVGALSRQQYTAMGDTVNVASRLEGMNKQFGTTILASGAIREQASTDFEFRALGSAHAKGRTAELAIFELAGTVG
jgi:adenylate cyclase